jgi:outer membrane protein OmpA-like peptidoglycan-associated protein
VRTYLTGRGIAPSRLSSRAVGEADLLSLEDNDSALALNRRTEFVFFGLLL